MPKIDDSRIDEIVDGEKEITDDELEELCAWVVETVEELDNDPHKTHLVWSEAKPIVWTDQKDD